MKILVKNVSFIVILAVIIIFVSCSKRDPAVQKLYDLRKLDFDKVEGVRHFVTTDSAESEEWRTKELRSGRGVYGHIDKKTGEYINKSVPQENVPLPTSEEMERILDENGEFLFDDEKKKK